MCVRETKDRKGAKRSNGVLRLDVLGKENHWGRAVNLGVDGRMRLEQRSAIDGFDWHCGMYQ